MTTKYPKYREEYLGDGLYASYDGWQIKLRAPREHGDHEVYLDDITFANLVEWVNQLRREQCQGD